MTQSYVHLIHCYTHQINLYVLNANPPPHSRVTGLSLPTKLPPAQTIYIG